jgi:hypothetical protein
MAAARTGDAIRTPAVAIGTFVARPSKRGVEFGFKKLFDKPANARPNPVFQGIEPIIE